jgi:hypothetical protein
MAKSKSINRRRSGAVTAEPRPHSRVDLGTRVDEISAVVKLAYDAVFLESGRNDTLNGAWCALGLALRELRAAREYIEAYAGLPGEVRP